MNYLILAHIPYFLERDGKNFALLTNLKIREDFFRSDIRYGEVWFYNSIVFRKDDHGEGISLNGQREGWWFEMLGRHAGKISKGYYHHDNKEGLWITYFSDGGIYAEENYLNGLMNGRSVSYYPDGKIEYEGTFHMGESVGDWVDWWEP